MDYLFNKYILAIGSILTPLIAIIVTHLQDAFYMLLVLIVLVTVDTLMGMYIAIKDGKFKSGKGGFWKVGDKLLCYFSLVLIVYTVLFLVQSVPSMANGVTAEGARYLVIFTFSVMYGRETFSIFESIDRLQPKLLPKALKEYIARIFNKELKIN